MNGHIYLPFLALLIIYFGGIRMRILSWLTVYINRHPAGTESEHHNRARPAFKPMQSDQALYCWLTNMIITNKNKIRKWHFSDLFGLKVMTPEQTTPKLFVFFLSPNSWYGPPCIQLLLHNSCCCCCCCCCSV